MAESGAHVWGKCEIEPNAIRDINFYNIRKKCAFYQLSQTQLVSRKVKICNPNSDGTFVVTGCPDDVKYAIEKIKVIVERYESYKEKN